MLILGAFLKRDIGHRIPGIDREIDQGVFQLGRINLAVPKFSGGDGFDVDVFLQGAAQRGPGAAPLQHTDLGLGG